MFNLSEPAWQIVTRAVVVYVAVLFGLRWAGKHEIGQMTIFDLVLLLLLANAVQNAIIGGDTSVVGGLIAAAALLSVNFLLTRSAVKWPRLGKALQGSPTILVLHGEVQSRNLAREAISRESLEAALREHGVASLEDVRVGD